MEIRLLFDHFVGAGEQRGEPPVWQRVDGRWPATRTTQARYNWAQASPSWP